LLDENRGTEGAWRFRSDGAASGLILVFATFGYMQRSASKAAIDAPPAPECDHEKRDRPLGCLILFDT